MSIKQMKTLTVGETTYQVVDSTVSDWAREPTKPNDFANGGTMGGSLVINGDLTVNGTSTTVETFNENINVEDNTITLRHNATTGLQTGDYTGIIAHKYDGTNNGMLVFDNTGTAYVGDEGDVQPLATRKLAAEDNGELVSWDAANQTLVKAPVKVENIVTKDNFDSLNTVLSTNTNNAEMSYVKDVPTDSANYAEVNKIGGMTRKCTNLIPFPYADGDLGAIKEQEGIVWTVNSDGSVKCQGTATGTSVFNFFLDYSNPLHLPNGQYIISNSVDDTSMRVVVKDATGKSTTYVNKFTINEGDAIERLYSVIYADDVRNVTMFPMLNSGSTALPYEPYFEGLRSAPVTEVESVGANIANCTVNKKVSGVTFSNIDGRCVLNGTATTVFSFDLVNVWLEAGTYTLGASGLNINGADRVYFKTVSNTIAYGNTTAKVKISEAGKYTIAIVLNTSSAYSNKDIELFLYEGSTSKPYTPYVRNTLPIPEAVRNLDGYGWGVNADCYNYIDWEKKQFVKRVGCVDMGTLGWIKSKGYAYSQNLAAKGDGACLAVVPSNITRYYLNGSGYIMCLFPDEEYADATTFKAAMSGVMLVYELAEPIITDISDLIGDNSIGVQSNGTLTFENEYGYVVPSEVVFYKEKAEIVAADKIVGNLIGVSTRAISDEDGNSIANTYMKKSNALEVISTLTETQLQKLISFINTIELQ